MTLTFSILSILAAFAGGFFGARMAQSPMQHTGNKRRIRLHRRNGAKEHAPVDLGSDPTDSLVRDWLVGTPKEGDD